MADDTTTTSRCPNCARLERRIAELEQQVAQLDQLLEKATRAQKRQAAPFSKGTHKQAGPPKARPQAGRELRPQGPSPASRTRTRRDYRRAVARAMPRVRRTGRRRPYRSAVPSRTPPHAR